PSAAVVRRTATRRREHRERALREHLARAATLTLETARVPLRDRRGQPLTDVAEGLLLGVLGAAGETLGIARVRAWDAARGVVVEELELEVVSDERGTVVVPGDADGLVRSGRVVPTRSVSVRLHAAVIPPASASAQSPDSNFFIADDPPLWGVSTLRGTVQRPCPWYDSSPRRYVAQRRLAA